FFMGRFLNPNKLGSSPASFTIPPQKTSTGPSQETDSRRPRTATVRTPVRPLAGLKVGSGPRVSPPPITQEAPTVPVSVMGGLGAYSLFFFLISPELNDLSQHFFQVNAYVSWVSQVLLVIAFIASGSTGRGLQLPIGKMWAIFTFLLALTVLFSTWRSESLSMMMNYVPRCTLFFFAICAFVVDIATLRLFLLAEIFKGLLILVICLTMGGDAGGRFAIPESSFYGGANDLALGLATSAGFFFYWVVQKNIIKMLLGTCALIASLYFLLKTSS